VLSRRYTEKKRIIFRAGYRPCVRQSRSWRKDGHCLPSVWRIGISSLRTSTPSRFPARTAGGAGAPRLPFCIACSWVKRYKSS
jgi:hypothetical protein